MSNCENRTYTVEDIAKMLNIGRTSAYNLTKEGHFKIVRIRDISKITKIPATSVSRYLQNGGASNE